MARLFDSIDGYCVDLSVYVKSYLRMRFTHATTSWEEGLEGLKGVSISGSNGHQ